MKRVLQIAIVLVLMLAFTPLGFTLMPLIVALAIIGGIYYFTMESSHHHYE